MTVICFEDIKKQDEAFGAAGQEARLNAAREAFAACEQGSERAVLAESELGECLFDQKRFVEALPHLESAAQRAIEVWGDDDELTIETLEALAVCLKRLGRDEEALDLCDQFGLDEDILNGRD